MDFSIRGVPLNPKSSGPTPGPAPVVAQLERFRQLGKVAPGGSQGSQSADPGVDDGGQDQRSAELPAYGFFSEAGLVGAGGTRARAAQAEEERLKAGCRAALEYGVSLMEGQPMTPPKQPTLPLTPPKHPTMPVTPPKSPTAPATPPKDPPATATSPRDPPSTVLHVGSQ